MRRIQPILFVSLITLAQSLSAATGGAIVPVTLSNTLAANDDGSSPAVPLNIGGTGGINFFGQNFTQVFVNNNGNLTFTRASGTFTPNGLATGVGQPIIAPFFADVDTDGRGSGLVMYGNAVVNGVAAFVANYVNVGYYGGHTNKLNSFQVVLLDRSDTGAGNFDIQLNYNQIQWETGDASGGSNGLGGTSAVAGYSNGQSGTSNVFFQLPGSLINGALLDGGPNSLAANSLNSTVPGQYIFSVRNGAVIVGPPPPPTVGPLVISGQTDLGTVPLGSGISGGVTASGGTPPYTWSALGSVPPGVIVGSGSVSGVPTQAGNYSVGVLVSDSAGASNSTTFTFSVFGFVSASLPAGIPFSPYSASVGIAGGTGPFTFSISGLPAGLSANVSGGIIGTVTRPGTSNVTVTATDSNGVSVSKTLTLTFVVPPPLSVSASTMPGGMVGQVYSQVLSGASGGAPPYTWSLASGALPDGLSVRASGTVAGLASRQGVFTFAVRATDVTGASAVGSVSLTIAPVPLSFTVPPLPNGVASVEYPAQTFAVQGGVAPYTFAVAGGTLPNGVTVSSSGTISGTPSAPGNYSVTLTATDSMGTVGTGTVAFTVRSFSTDIILSTASTGFSLIAGTSLLPDSQIVAVQSSTPATVIPYSVSVSPASANWFTVSPAGGSTPGTLSVALNSQALTLAASATPYQATVSVACQSPAPCAGNSQTFNVSVTVINAPPQLNVLSSLISFSAPPGSTQAMSQTLGLQNAGGGTIGIASVSCAASWCGVAGVPGTITAGQTANLTVTVNPSGLSANYYRTVIAIKASTGTVNVPVTLFVAAGQSVSLQPAGEQFQSFAGGMPNGPDTSFLVDVSGGATLSWSATVLPGAPWLTLSSSSGTASAAQPGMVSFTLNPAMTAALAPQTYYATIRVTSPGIVNSPQDFEIVLNVGPANGAQRPSPSPSGLLFISQAASVPPPQTVSVSTDSAFAVSAQASASTSDGANWLSVTPATGLATPGTPLLTKVSVNPAKLASGVYFGSVSYAFAGLAIRTVNVTLIVSPTAAAAHLSGLTPQAPAACTPTQVVMAQTGLVNSFAQPASWPTPIQMLLVDDCANPVPNGQVVATFSNGDPPLPLNLADVRSGLYAGTWTPRRVAQQTTITMRGTAPGFAAVTFKLAGSVTPNVAPVLAPFSTQHIFNPLVGGALAPGTLVQISGTGLSASGATAPGGSLPLTLNGTQVIIGGVPAAISSVSASAINAEIPLELAPGMQYQVIVSANGALTTPDPIQLAGTAPGVATGTAAMAGIVSATHANGTAVTEASPATPGEALVLLAAGLGLTDTAVADGAVSPASPLANALDAPTLTIDGNPAVITSSVLQPGMVGLYQVAFTVPAGANNGDLALILSQDGQPGNSGVLPVKKTP